VIDVDSSIRNLLHALWPDLQIKTLNEIETGWDSRVAEVNGSWIFRVPRGEYGAKALAVEQALLPELAGALTAPIPRFEYFSIAPPCAGYKKIEGRPLDEVSALRGHIAEDLGVFLRALHSVPVDRAGASGVKGVKEWRTDLVTEFADFRDRVLPLIDGKQRPRAAQFIDSFIEDESNFDFDPAVVHADLGGSHILCGEDRLRGIIDWGDVRIGDPAIDFAWVANEMPAAFVSRLLKSYGPKADEHVLRRALFFHRIGPWHEVVYGLDRGGEHFVRSGLAGVRARLP
jgi:aminoglycoside phosphotransferase (APT) family kinase protein